MLIKEVMNRGVQTIKKEATIQDAARKMNEFSIGCLIVASGSSVVGIITERDIMKKVVAEARDSSKTRVKDVMTEEVVMASPEMDIEEAAQLMMDRKIKKLPVVKDKELIGIVTATDICMASPKIIEQMGRILLLPKKGGNKTLAG